MKTLTFDFLSALQKDGFPLKKVSDTNGGEYCGACPFCGGRDRFRVWPYHNGGRYWCRRCDKAGDSIQYLRVRRGLSYLDACQLMGTSIGPCGPARSRRKSSQAWIPKDSTAPVAEWQAGINNLIEVFPDFLWSRQGDKIRAWLHDRGLNDATIKVAGLGLNTLNRYRDRESWGLSTELNENGRHKKIKISAGLVIPYIVGGNVQRLRVRAMEPNADPKYTIVTGSSTAPMILFPFDRAHAQACIVVVESDLDAILLNQEAGDLVSVISIGSAAGRPDTLTHTLLMQAETILLALDADEAGAKASWQFWIPTYGEKVKRWPVPVGKDPGEAWQQGFDLRLWIQAGLAPESVVAATSTHETGEDIDNILPFPTAWLQQLSETQLERLAIMTIDGGLADGDAIKSLEVM